MTETKKIRVLIVDDHPIVKEGLACFASVREELEVVGLADSGHEAVELARSMKPDVIVMDIQMPEMDGVEATKLIRQENTDTKILMLSTFSDEERVFAAIDAGASGYLLKETAPDELMRAIRDVYNGETPLHSRVAKKLLNDRKRLGAQRTIPDPLTERELEVLRNVAQGLSNMEISKKMNLSTRTVGGHVGNILGKLGLDNRTQAALYALEEGIVKKNRVSES